MFRNEIVILFALSVLSLCSGRGAIKRAFEFENCGTNGEIIKINISNCEWTPCTFYTGDVLTLEYEYVTDTTFEKLDFSLSLIDHENGQVLPIRFVRGSVGVVANISQESYISILINQTVPHGKMWDMEIVRTWEDKEVCATFPVEINPIEVTETTTVKSTTASPPDQFECEEVGFFPDPFECATFHECQLFLNGSLWDSVFTCPNFTVWCQETLECEYDSTCHCDINLYYLI